MKERELTNLFGKSCNESGYHFVNIPDSMSSNEMDYDAVLNYNGLFIGIEFKRLTKWCPFNPKELRPSQIRGLQHTHKTNGIALVGLFIWIPRQCNELILLEWSEVLKMTSNLTKSIPKDYLKSKMSMKCKKRKFNLIDFPKIMTDLIGDQNYSTL